jgi:hypothetical protein
MRGWVVADERERLSDRLRQIAESQRMDFNSPNVAKTLDEVAELLSRTPTTTSATVPSMTPQSLVNEPAGSGDAESLAVELYNLTELGADLPHAAVMTIFAAHHIDLRVCPSCDRAGGQHAEACDVDPGWAART